MVSAGKSLAIQLCNQPLQPILNGNGIAAKGDAVGPVECPVLRERVLDRGALPHAGMVAGAAQHHA